MWHKMFITNIKVKTKRINKKKKYILKKKGKKQDLKVHRSGQHNKRDRRIYKDGEMGAGYIAIIVSHRSLVSWTDTMLPP